jgi:poly(A) polymerase
MSLPELIAPIRATLGLDEGWLVGGAVRDLVLDRAHDDWDVIVADDAAGAARVFARRGGGAPFPLSDRHSAWRVVDGGRTVDFTTLNGATLAEDLGRRDLTVNAIAVGLADGAVSDPYGGLRDLEDRVLRAVTDEAFRDDPLRLLRLPRLAVELDFAIAPDTAALATRDAHRAPEAAGECQFAELQRIIGAADPADALLLCERLGVLAAVLPEVAALRGVEQSTFHHLDVLDHTVHVIESTADIAANVGHYFAEEATAAAIDAALAARLDGTMDVRAGLRFGALLHDIAKPTTRVELGDGKVKFFGHEKAGVAMLDGILGRFNASAALRELCAVLVGHHLTLGFKIRERPLTPRVAYRYALDTAPYPLPSVVLSLGDRLATRGGWTRQRGLRRHHETAQEMAAAIVALGSVPPRLVAPADRIGAAVGIEPGPALGALVAALQEEQAAGEVRNEAEAIAFARSFITATEREDR